MYGPKKLYKCLQFVSQGKIDWSLSQFFQKFNTRQLFRAFGSSSVVSVIRIRLAFSFALIWFPAQASIRTGMTPNYKSGRPLSFHGFNVIEDF